MPTDNEFTRILQWPGYRVYRHEINEKNKILDLWVRRKRGNRKLECSGCGRKFSDAYDCRERAVHDLPWSEFKSTVHIEVYRVKCPDCGVRVEKVPLLPSKAPFSKRFEDAVGQACESAAARQVARRFGLTEAKMLAQRFWVDAFWPGGTGDLLLGNAVGGHYLDRLPLFRCGFEPGSRHVLRPLRARVRSLPAQSTGRHFPEPLTHR